MLFMGKFTMSMVIFHSYVMENHIFLICLMGISTINHPFSIVFSMFLSHYQRVTTSLFDNYGVTPKKIAPGLIRSNRPAVWEDDLRRLLSFGASTVMFRAPMTTGNGIMVWLLYV